MKGMPKGKATRYGGYKITKYYDGSFDIKRNNRTVAIGEGGIRMAKLWIDMKV